MVDKQSLTIGARLLDFHTHKSGVESYEGVNTIVVQSTFIHEQPHPRADYYTTGIHPMDTVMAHEVLNAGPSSLRSLMTDKIKSTPGRLLGLGELGWDRRSQELSLEDQSLLVGWQLDLAEELQLPVIFHMVGHWDQLMREHHNRKPHTAWWVHGFRGKGMLLTQLQAAGLFVSISPKYTWQTCPSHGAFLLETDEETGALQASYQRAASALGVSVTDLAHELQETFSKLHPLV